MLSSGRQKAAIPDRSASLATSCLESRLAISILLVKTGVTVLPLGRPNQLVFVDAELIAKFSKAVSHLIRR